MMSDADDRIEFVDANFAEALGYLPRDLVGRPAVGLVARSHRLAIVQAAAALRRGDEPTAVVRTAFESASGAAIPAHVVLSLRQADANRQCRAGLVCTVLIDEARRSGPSPDGPATATDRRASRTPGLAAAAAHPSAAQVRGTPDLPAPELAQLLRAAETTALAVQGLLAATDAAVAAATAATAKQQARGREVPRYQMNGQMTDTLTGLATRATLVSEMHSAVRNGMDVAVLLVDLDEFKAVNDTHGHDIGDEVLVQVADRLRACVRPDDLVVRFGGDEFVILCRAAAGSIAVASRIVSLLAPPIETAAGPVPITASVGISDCSIPMDADSDLLTRADTAMYWAKALGKNRYFSYDSVLHERVIQEGRVRMQLRTAVADGRIAVHYQPIMSTGGGSVIGVEAVARLIGDNGDIVLPAEFLPVAERTGLVAGIDAAVLTESCRCVGALVRAMGRPLAVSVNVSRKFIARTDLVEFVSQVLADADLPPSALMLELTEESLADAESSAIERLAELRVRGVQVALDNFSAGYAPLSLLRDLPLTYVKVDRPCIVRMMANDRDAAMIQAVTWLVDRLGLCWIAEGVETVAEWQAVRRFGPGLAQGYLFAKPLAEDALVRHLRAQLRGGADTRLGDLATA